MIRTPTCRALFDYWNAVRGERIAPRRFEIEPSRIADILADTFILERVDRAHYRYRLAGTRMCDGLAAEFRGASFLDHWQPDARGRLVELLSDVAGRGAIALLRAEVPVADAAPRTFEFIVLPLLHTGQSVERFLGAASPVEPALASTARVAGLPGLVEAETFTPEDIGLTAGNGPGATRQMPLSVLVRSARIVRHNRRHFRVYDGGLAQETPRPPRGEG
ncbi:MAG: PAS domain-containing protein [Hyphomicrobiaceae bacterium]|nr:PAS domain-containing protein [Hyphomicrobiaceae bacterium]